MGAYFATGLGANNSRRPIHYGHRTIVAVALLGGLFAGAFTLAIGKADAAKGDRTATLSINRTNKGDRLTAARPNVTSTNSSPLVTTMRRPPIGCDAAFSRNADPGRGHIFGRCVS